MYINICYSSALVGFRIGINCARGLEYGPRPKAENRTRDRNFSTKNSQLRKKFLPRTGKENRKRHL